MLGWLSIFTPILTPCEHFKVLALGQSRLPLSFVRPRPALLKRVPFLLGTQFCCVQWSRWWSLVTRLLILFFMALVPSLSYVSMSHQSETAFMRLLLCTGNWARLLMCISCVKFIPVCFWPSVGKVRLSLCVSLWLQGQRRV